MELYIIIGLCVCIGYVHTFKIQSHISSVYTTIGNICGIIFITTIWPMALLRIIQAKITNL